MGTAVAAEKERIPGQFINTVYNCEDRQHEIYIRHHQKSLIGLADRIYHYLLPKDPQSIYKLSPGEEIVNFYKEVFRCIEELLYFIEHNFKEYFNQDEKVTDVYLHIMQQGLKEKWSVLRKQFKKNKIDEDLVKIIMRTVVVFCRKEKVSYRQLLYVKSITHHLAPPHPQPFSTSGEGRNGEGSNDKGIIRTLVYLNFNTGDFISYCLAKIVDAINVLPEQKDKIEKLLQYRKEYYQLQVKPGVALKPGCVSVKELVCTWINEEIHYLETKYRLLSVAPVIKDDKLLSDEEKLHFSVSVHVLGILARAAHDSKLLLNKKGTSVFKNVAKYCRTLQAKNPGAGSMDRKSHVAERGHKEKAINVLQDMIKWVHGY
ncbi:MAG: hypothetical protein ABI675_21385 [Chitinophagaceae bacterium]